jgi:hypothetical protein
MCSFDQMLCLSTSWTIEQTTSNSCSAHTCVFPYQLASVCFWIAPNSISKGSVGHLGVPTLPPNSLSKGSGGTPGCAHSHFKQSVQGWWGCSTHTPFKQYLQGKWVYTWVYPHSLQTVYTLPPNSLSKGSGGTPGCTHTPYTISQSNCWLLKHYLKVHSLTVGSF